MSPTAPRLLGLLCDGSLHSGAQLAAALGVRTHMLSVTNIDRTVDRAVSYAQRLRRPVVLGIPYDLVSAEAVLPVPRDTSTPAQGIALGDPAVLAALSASVADTPRQEDHIGGKISAATAVYHAKAVD